MSAAEFEARNAGVLAALRAERGRCPDLDALIDQGGEVDEVLARHLELCPTCRRIARPEAEEIDDVSWKRVERRLDAGERPWLAAKADVMSEAVNGAHPAGVGSGPEARREGDRSRRGGRWIGLAATVLMVVGVAAIWQGGKGEEPTGAPADVPIATTRGQAIRVLAPVGEVGEVDSLRWQSPMPLELHYRVEIRRQGVVVWEGESSTTELRSSPELVALLQPGVVYEWRLTGFEGDRQRGESDWVEFTIRP